METLKKNAKEPEIIIRDMVIDDLAPAFHLGEKLFTLNISPNLYRVWDEYEIIDFFQTSGDYCISAFSDNQFAGFVVGSLIEKRRSTRKYGYLVWIGVDPSFGRSGIATKLFKEFKNRMVENGATSLLIDTQADNKAALSFFKKRGFASPQDHIYLSLDLTKAGKNNENK